MNRLERVIFGASLDDKLTKLDEVDFNWKWSPIKLPQYPAREERIKFSQTQIKFPKPNSLHDKNKKAQAIHAFANHELLAMEMMALALLYYPHDHSDKGSIRSKLGLLASLRDEQKHFKLYIKLLDNMGFKFGDFPLNGFFWSKMKSFETMEQFLAGMSLTFEQANLDFATYYRDAFLQIGDTSSAAVLNTVLEDEIRHVALGVHILNHNNMNEDLWEYYCEVLPFPLTPSRAKGMVINREARRKAGLSEHFIQSLIEYDDQFRVTKRKQWKS